MKTAELLIKGRALFDGHKYLADQAAAVLVQGTRIKALGNQAMADAGTDIQVLDCAEQTLLPGLIDCHNHLSLDPLLPGYLLRMQDALPELTLRAVRTMQCDLLSGVTTSRCLGDREFLDIHCQRAQAAGRLAGPRLVVATRGIRAPHGHGFVGYPFCGPEDIRTAVRENLLAGADLIKIYLTGSLRSTFGLPCTFSEQEVRILVEEAHRAGRSVATHCIGGPGLELALRCGIDVIEHGYFMTPEQIKALADSPAWLVLTPSIFFNDARLETLHGRLKEVHLEQRCEVARVMEQVVASKVRWAIGTDAMHGELVGELEHLVGFGASAAQAIAGVTLRAAEMMGMENEIGSLAPGKMADVIGVNGNPLENVSVLKKVSTVVQAGKVIKADLL